MSLSNSVLKSLKAVRRHCAHVLLSVFLIGVSSASAQTDNAQPPSNDTIKQLMDRLAAAEAKIKQLQDQMVSPAAPVSAPAESATPNPPPPSAAAATPAVASAEAQAPEPPPAPEESHEHMMAIPGGPVLHFRGFFDLNFDDGQVAQQLQYPLGVPAKASFRAGEFDLFLTSQLSEKLSFLSEVVFSTDPGNGFGIDLERFQLTYRPSRYFEISGGRFHTAIGYYNTAFHHGNWFSTATGRPFMYYFEDSGGPLPVHEVGVTTTGYVPSGKLNLHWVAEVGNGSAEVGSPLYGDGVENFATDRNRKDINFAAYIRPEWLDGLQIGGSFLNGNLIPSNGLPSVNQTVSSAYAVLINSKWEFMNEFVLMHHQITQGGRSFNSPMGYTHLAYHFNKFRPYSRFQEVNIPESDPVTFFKGRYEGPSFGIRWDAFRYACLKLQYNRVYLSTQAPQNGFELQSAFTF
jgi:hypothetical protein